MNKIFRNLSLMLVAGALVASCADYNETDNFKADPDPSFVIPYKDLKPVKSYTGSGCRSAGPPAFPPRQSLPASAR